MRILYHHRSLLDGAEGVHVREMIRAFEALGHSVTVKAPAAAGGDRTHNGARIVRRVLPRRLFEVATAAYNVAEWHGGRRAIRRVTPAFLYQRHALNDMGMLRAARDAGVPSVLEVNVLYSSPSLGQFEPPGFLRLVKATERMALELATVVVTVSSPLKQLVHELAPRAQSVVVVPNGVDPVRYHPLISGAAVRRRYDIPEQVVVVGWCGIMRPWHGLELLLEAISRTGLFLLMIGDGPERARVERLCREFRIAERVRFVGRIPETAVPEHLAAIDIGVVADDLTRYASPMKMLEYMAMGKPVVAPNLPNIRDVVTDGTEGLLFEPGRVESLTARLARLEDATLRASIGRRGRAGVEANRNWVANAQQVLGAVRAASGLRTRCAQSEPISDVYSCE